MTVLHIDYEVYSEIDLKTTGVYPYAEHPSTEIIACTFQFDDGIKVLWVPYDYVPKAIVEGVKQLRPDISIICKSICPTSVAEHIASGGEVRAHNAQYERVVTNGVAGQRLGIPALQISQMVCTAVKAAASGIPRHLEDGAKALGTPQKNAGGRIEMLQLTKPRKPTKDNPDTRYTMEKYPDKWIAMLVYNVDDVTAEVELDRALPDIIPSEREIYCLDQRINDRGVAVDLRVVSDILTTVEAYKEHLAVRMQELTADWMGDGLKPTQREKISEWVRANGYPNLVDMQAGTVKAILREPTVPELVKEVLAIYSTYNSKAVTKLEAMRDAVCADGRLRGMFIMDGAGPGRWSSQVVQLQNMMRPVIDDPEPAIEAFATRDWRYVQMLYEGTDLMKVAGSCTRACLRAKEGHDLIFVDFSGIESRVNPWFFGEEWVLEAFRKQDKEGGFDNYMLAYSTAFNVDPASIDWKSKAGKDKRQIGKCMELFFNYEGGVAAFLTAVDTYGVDLEAMTRAVLPVLSQEAREHGEWMWANGHRVDGVTYDQALACNGLKYLWRKTHPHIKQGWKDLKKACEQAAEFPGQAFGIPSGKIWFKVMEYNGRKWMHMRLPSGRDIKYYNPRWIEPKTITRPQKVDGGWIDVQVEVPGEFRYYGQDDKFQFTEMSTYGGHLDENADQGFSSCLLRRGMLNLDAAGYPIVLHAHDEAVLEVPKGWGSVEEAEKLMCAQDWDGLPLNAEGKRQERYWK